MITASQICAAFGLPSERATLASLRHADFPTWRLNTSTGSYVVKRLVEPTEDFPRERFDRAMTLERSAIAAGIRTAEPVPPVHAGLGWCTKITGHGWFRAHAWVDHRPMTATDDIASWLGHTMATLHRLLPDPSEPDWPMMGIYPGSTWQSWFDEATSAGHEWGQTGLARLPYLEELTEHLRLLYSRPGRVLTHGDIDPGNVLITYSGPVLIDWDTVWPYSPTLQAGHVAHRFSGGDTGRALAILAAYRDAGGQTDTVGDALFHSIAGQKLASLAIQITVLLGQLPAPRWMDTANADRLVEDRLRGLADFVADLTDQAKRVLGQAGADRHKPD